MSEEKKAWGRTLEEFQTIEGYNEQKLYPAELGLMQACENCVPYICPKSTQKRPNQSDKRVNLIRFDFLRFLILGGDKKAIVDAFGLRLSGAFIARGEKGRSNKLDLMNQEILFHVSLCHCHFAGNLKFKAARIQSLNLSGSKIKAFLGDRVFVKGSLIFRNGFQAQDRVRLLGAKIYGDLSCTGGSFLASGTSLHIQSAEIKGRFFLRNGCQIFGKLDCATAKVNSLVLDRDSWLSPTEVALNGFIYNRFGGDISKLDSQFWLEEFLAKQNFKNQDSTSFAPYAHKQLAKVLMEMGHEEEARAILIDRRRRSISAEWERVKDHGRLLPWLTVVWSKLSGLAIGYGYRPGLAAIWMLAIWLAFTPLYFYAKSQGIMTPSDPLIYQAAYDGRINKICRENWTTIECGKHMPSEHSEFYSPAYSLDVLLPIINFRQQDDWAPRVVNDGGKRNWLGWTVRKLEWTQTALGWLLSLLLVSGVTGIIRRD